jgi:hypothetical protein
MKKPRRLKIAVYRFLTIVAVAASMAALPASTSSSQSDCCNKCLERFSQCDGTTIVCCRIYRGCVQQCQGGCPSCPDEE